MHQALNIASFFLGFLLVVSVGLGYCENIDFEPRDLAYTSCIVTSKTNDLEALGAEPYGSDEDTSFTSSCVFNDPTTGICVKYYIYYYIDGAGPYVQALDFDAACVQSVIDSMGTSNDGVMDGDETGIDCGGSTGRDCVDVCQSGDILRNGMCTDLDSGGALYPPFSAPDDDSYQSIVDSLDPYDENRDTDDGFIGDIPISSDSDVYISSAESWNDATTTETNDDGSTTTTSSGGTLSIVDSGDYEYTTITTETTEKTDGTKDVKVTETKTDSSGNKVSVVTNKYYDSDGNLTGSDTTTMATGDNIDQEQDEERAAKSQHFTDETVYPGYGEEDIPYEESIVDTISSFVSEAPIFQMLNGISVSYETPQCLFQIEESLFGHTVSFDIDFCRWEDFLRTCGNVLLMVIQSVAVLIIMFGPQGRGNS
nr:hypothetical protein [uncultured Desulfuromonas sp.]